MPEILPARRGIGRTEILVGIAVVAVLALVTVPLAVSMSRKSRRSEVPDNVEAIRTAELEYHRAFSEYIGADAAPRPPHAVDAEVVPWQPSEGFGRLSWAPAQDDVRGSYSVTLTKDGFVVNGACDVDGDGERALYRATETEPATQVTDGSVY